MAANNKSSNSKAGSKSTSSRGRASGSTSRSSGTSRNTNRSNTASKQGAAASAANPEKTREIYFFVFLAVSVFLLLSNFRICGFVGNLFSGFFFGLFGWVTYILPFYLFFSAAFLLSNGTNKAVVKKIIWVGIAFLLVGFIMQLISGAEGVTIKKLYMEGYKNRKGGGIIFGGMLSLLYKLIGKVGCIILTTLFVIVALIEILNISVIDLFKRFGTSFKNSANTRRTYDDEIDDEYYGDDDIDDEYDSVYGGSLRAGERTEKHILQNTTILDENNKKINSDKKTGKKKKVEYPKDEMVELASDGSVKDIFNSKKKNDGTESMPDFLKDSHKVVQEQRKKAEENKTAMSDAESYDAYQSISGLGSSSVSAAPDEPVYVDDGTRVERSSGRTGIHTRERSIKTDIFDLKPVRDDSYRRTSSDSRSTGRKSDIFGSTRDSAFNLNNSSSDSAFEQSNSTYDSAFGQDSSTSDSAFDSEYNAVYDSDKNIEEEYTSENTLNQENDDISSSAGTKTSQSGAMGRYSGSIFAADNNAAAASGHNAGKTFGGSAQKNQQTAGASSAASAAKSSNDPSEAEIVKPKRPREYKFPPMNLLSSGKGKGSSRSNEEAVRENGVKLKETLESFGVNVTITDYSVGPSVTRFEMQPEQGVKVSKIVGLQDDIKLALAAEDIRIEAPIPGKPAIGIEIPNKENQVVYFRDIIDNEKFKGFNSNLAFAVGKDIGGQVILTDIAKAPHLLIAGATGSGKSVCINTIIMSILYKAKPDDVKMIMIDPKMVELTAYNGIPHLLIPVVTDPKKAAGALNWAVVEMTKRYQKFAEYNVRNIKGFNDKVKNEGPKDNDPDFRYMPQILVIVDELADLMMVAHQEVEDAIIRLCQLARAAGIHLIIATQRPSVDVITGLIKANVPSRIAFAVSSGIDSRTILDMNGAEKLLGKGDMLFYPTGFPKPVRVQGALVSDDEVMAVVNYIKKYNDGSYDEEVSQSINNSSLKGDNSQGSSDGSDDGDRYDELFEEAARLVIEKDKASIGNLQRVFRIGFNRAARIMDQLCDAGVVGPEEGTKPRKILMTMDQFDEYMSV